MKFGLYSSIADPPRGEHIDRAIDEVIAEAQLAESLGFDSCFFGEHHQDKDGFLPSPLIVATAVAARTTKLKVGTSVILLPLHHPIHLAEDVITLDLVSKGRVIIGVGIGYQPADFDASMVAMDERLADDQKLGALELILSTPLTVREILLGQFLALRRQFLGPLLVVVVVQLGLTIALAHHTPYSASRIYAYGRSSLLLLFADLAAVSWVAIAAALTAKTPNHASVSTIFRLLILPWLLWFVIVTIGAVWLLLHGRNEPGWEFYLNLLFWLGLLADAVFGIPAWWRVRTRFRQLALQRLSASKPIT